MKLSRGLVTIPMLMAAALAASDVNAQQVASKDPKAVKAGTYVVEPTHSQVIFSVSHFGFTDFSGFFTGASGTLQLDPAKVSTAKLDVTVPVQTILTTVPALTEELKKPTWLDSSKFANAEFKSTKVTSTGPDTATIVGDFTLHGVTKPLTLKAHLVGSGENPLDKSFTLGFEATGSFKRSDFDVKQYLPLLADQVDLKIAGSFTLQK